MWSRSTESEYEGGRFTRLFPSGTAESEYGVGVRMRACPCVDPGTGRLELQKLDTGVKKLQAVRRGMRLSSSRAR